MTQLKKNLFRTLAAVAALALLCTGLCLTDVFAPRSVAAAEEEQEIVSSYPYTTVTKDKVNLRKSRSVKSTLIAKIPAGAEITVKSKNGSWVEVEYGKYKGWVMAEYVVLKTVKKIKVTPTPSPAPTLSPQEDAGGYKVLKRGSTGIDVRSLQEALIELGFLTGTADANFGDATEKAVIAFQQKNGGETPTYAITGTSGPPHDPVFEAAVYRDGQEIARGTGRTKKQAEQAAALAALKVLQ